MRVARNLVQKDFEVASAPSFLVGILVDFNDCEVLAISVFDYDLVIPDSTY